MTTAQDIWHLAVDGAPTPISELVGFEALKVSGVDKPANGTPFIVLKSESTDMQRGVTSTGNVPTRPKKKRKGKNSNNAGELSEQDIRGGARTPTPANNVSAVGAKKMKALVRSNLLAKAADIERAVRSPKSPTAQAVTVLKEKLE